MGNMYERILELCTARGIKPGRVCADTGLSRGMMSDLKMGRTKELSAKNTKIIAEYFGVSVGYLMGQETEKAPTPEDERNNANSGLSDIYFSLAKDLQDAKIDPDDIRNFAKIIAKNMNKSSEEHD